MRSLITREIREEVGALRGIRACVKVLLLLTLDFLAGF